MKPNPDFQNLPKFFWAAVRTISQHCGYTKRGSGTVNVPMIEEMQQAYSDLGLSPEALDLPFTNGKPIGERLEPVMHFDGRGN